MHAVQGSCHGGASKMWPNPRTVSGPGEVWRRTSSSGRRFRVLEFDAIGRSSREDYIYLERLSFRSLCAERGLVWARYERCHVGSMRMLLERFAARASRGPIGSGYLIYQVQASRRELGRCNRSLGSRGPPAHPTPQPILCVRERTCSIEVGLSCILDAGLVQLTGTT